MKKSNFLIKLLKENKIESVEQSKDISDSYIKKSESNIISAKILLENKRLEESVGLAYYGMYHMLTALLFSVGIKCENHAGSIIMLKEIFQIENSDISFAKKERVDKQYYTGFEINEQETKEAILAAEKFNKKILDIISKLDSEKVKKYKDLFNRYFNKN